MIEQVKRYAVNQGVSLSQLIEQYFKMLVRHKLSKDKKLKKAALQKLPVCTSSEMLVLLKNELTST